MKQAKEIPEFADQGEVLSLMPQAPPFLFVDRILEVDESRIQTEYTFRESEVFYPGHFPGNPVTPGVILLEAMAQAGAVAHAIWLMLGQGRTVKEMAAGHFLFTRAQDVEFLKVVLPGETVRITGQKVYFRSQTIQSRVEAQTMDNEPVCSALVTGKGFMP